MCQNEIQPHKCSKNEAVYVVTIYAETFGAVDDVCDNSIIGTQCDYHAGILLRCAWIARSQKISHTLFMRAEINP